jgi:hypothetical protein
MPEKDVVCQECNVPVEYLKNMERIINKNAGQSAHLAEIWYQEIELYSCPECNTIFPKIAKEEKVRPFSALKRM